MRSFSFVKYNRASHTKKDGVKDDLLSLSSACKESHVFNKRRVPCIFTVLDLYEMYFPCAQIELVSSAYISIRLSWA